MPPTKLIIECNNDQQTQPVDETRLLAAIRRILTDAEITAGEISLAIVDDSRMHELNRQFLQHDYPTDVLSFVLDEEPGFLEGEVIVSADYAAREAVRYGWSTDDELLLYVIHGTLHLVGYDDLNPAAKREMRVQEQHYLGLYGLQARYAAGDGEE